MSTIEPGSVHLNPFPGLRPFKQEEEYLFFGRENQVDTMVDKLAGTHFLAVVGTSGSGKSSLVNCGLRPALHRGLMVQAGNAWRVAQFRPGGHPIRAMAKALARENLLFRDFKAEGMMLVDVIETTLRMSKLGLVDIYEQARLDTDQNLLVVVDQFEELFRYQRFGATHLESVYAVNEETIAFVNLLLEIKSQANCPIYIALTMRSDFLGDCTQFPGLADAINEGQYLTPRLTRDDRRAAIGGPIAVGGAEIAPVLLTRLVNDVGDNPDQLSILQHALNRTWSSWHTTSGGNGPLDLGHYEAIGTMSHALDQHAEKAYSELSTQRQRQICEGILKALTDKASDPRGVRCPTKLGTLCALVDATEAEVTGVIDVFRKPSRSFLMPPLEEVLETETVIDISHESLMRVWKRLITWADNEARSVQIYRRLAETSVLHEEGDAGLWRNPDLEGTLKWKNDQNPNKAWADQYGGNFDLAMKFLETSKHESEREIRETEEMRQRELIEQRRRAEEQQQRAEAEAKDARRMRRISAFLGLTIILGLAAGVYSLITLRDLKKTRDEVRVHELTRDVTLNMKTNPGLSILHAIPAVSLASTAETMALLRDALDASKERRVFSGHDFAVKAIAFSPNGNRVVTVDKGEIKVWDVESNNELVSFDLVQKYVKAIAFSPDGQRVVIAGENTVKIWDQRSGSELKSFQYGPVDALALTRGGKRMATARKGTIIVWEVESGEKLASFESESRVTSIALSSAGHHVAAINETTIQVWNVESGEKLASFESKSRVTSIALSSAGHHVAAKNETTIQVWNVESGEGPKDFKLGTETDDDWPILSRRSDRGVGIAFNEDGKYLAVTDANRVRVFDFKNPASFIDLLGHTKRIIATTFSPDGRRIATASYDKTARLWENTLDVRLSEFKKNMRRLSKSAFSPDGQRVVGVRAGTITVWDVGSGDQLKHFSQEPRSRVDAIAFSADGQRVVTANKRSLKIWDVESGDELRSFKLALLDRVYAVGLVENEPSVATASWGVIKVWRLKSGKEQSFNGPRRIDVLAFDPTGTRIVTASKETIKVWEVESGEELMSMSHDAPVISISFSSDGKRLIVANSEKVAIWDLVSEEKLASLSGVERVISVALSSNDEALVTLRADGNVQSHPTNQHSSDAKKLILFASERLQPILTLQKCIVSERTKQCEIFSLLEVGRYLARGGDTKGAMARFQQAERLDPESSLDPEQEVNRWAVKGLVAAARKLARDGNTDNAIVKLREANRLEPELSLDPKQEVNRWAGEGLVAAGRKLAKDGNTDEAIAKLREAKRLDPGSSIDPEQEVNRWAAETLVSVGKKLARYGKTDEAIAKFREAKRLDPGSSLDPEEVNRWVAEGLVSAGKKLARYGNTDEAIAKLREAKRLDPGSSIDPEQEVNRWAAETLVSVGKKLARYSKTDEAIAKFREAKRLDPGSSLDPEEVNRWVAEGLVSAGKKLARYGKTDEAIAKFREAKRLDPGSSLDPEEVNRWAAEGLVSAGKKLAKDSKTDEAIAKFREAKRLDPESSLDPEQEVNRWAGEGLVSAGRKLAKDGNTDEAIAKLREAKRLDPESSIDPEQEVNRWAAEGLVSAGRKLAKDGKTDKAIAKLREAKRLDPESSIDPEQEVNRWAAETLVSEGKRLAREGNTDEAIAKLREAKRLDPESDPKFVIPYLLKKAKKLLKVYKEHKTNEAIKLYNEVQQIDANQITPRFLNTLCWNGGIGEALAGKDHISDEIIKACERVVEQAEANDRAGYHDSRGVVRALRGDTKGAIEDFKYYITSAERPRGQHLQRLKWIQDLQEEVNPFDKKTLKSLMSQ